MVFTTWIDEFMILKVHHLSIMTKMGWDLELDDQAS